MEQRVRSTTTTPICVSFSGNTIIFKWSLKEQTLSLPVVLKIKDALEASEELVETDC